jgi:hypothetical protein
MWRLIPEVGLPHEDRFHVMVVFVGSSFTLFAGAPTIVLRVVSGPTPLSLHTPGHGFQHPARSVTIVVPNLAGEIIVGSSDSIPHNIL